MFVCSECYVLSGRGLCDELITRPEESYRMWCILVCDLETSWMRRHWPTWGCRAKKRSDSYGLKCFIMYFMRSLLTCVFWSPCIPVIICSQTPSIYIFPFLRTDIWYDIFVNCNCVVTGWQ